MSTQLFHQVQCSFLCGLFISLLTLTHTFSYAPKPQIVITGPQLKLFKPQTRSSYFGYTIVMRTSSVIIGAPRAQSTLESQRKVNESGAIYRCSLDKPNTCYPYIFDEHGNRNIEQSDYTYDSEKRDFQWLGAAMDGGLKDSDKFIVCAPRFIAPVANVDYLMHGLCYWINDTLAEKPTNVRKISPLRLKQDQIRRDDDTKFYYYMLAEQGLSAHVTPDNEEFLIGAPGIHTWKGSVIRHRKKVTNDDPSLSRRDTERALRMPRQVDFEDVVVYYESDIPNPQNFGQQSDSYFGYSVSSGYFDSNNRDKILYLASAPQADEQSGEAYIFDYSDDRITKYYVFRGEQFGEYFGYAILAEDINGDGLTDVIVAAPQYRVTGLFDDGAIYVFVNQGRFNFERKLVTSPIHGKARFGTTLTSLGDINHDGYNDIAVSAPFAGDGSVFVYLGGERGLRDQHSQRLISPNGLIQSPYGSHMFGHGLSKGSDIDGNGFNDIAIGAPNAETVLLYKAYPVVKILATLRSDTREIKPGQSTFPLSVCYGISTTSSRIRSQELAMHIVVDPQVKRVTISSTGRNEMKFNAVAQTQLQCRIMDCSVKFIESEIFKPIELELHYTLVNQVPDSEVFCETCAAVDPAEPKVFSEKIIFSTGCASEICIADMKVESRSLDQSYILGSSRTLKVTYDVSNNGETAYLPQINITSSNRLPFAKNPSNCKVHESVMLCDLNRGQAMAKGAKDSVTVIYDVSNLSGTAMILSAEVFSTGKEQYPGNNIVKDVITLGEFTEIEAFGSPKTPHINLEKMSNKAEVRNYYEIKSNGPSNVGAMKVIFNIPVAYRIFESSAMIPIIDMDNITMQASYNSQLVVFDFYQNNITLVRNSVSTMSSGTSSTFTRTISESSNSSSHYSFMSTEHVNKMYFKNTNNRLEDSVISASMSQSRKRRNAAALTANKDQYARIAEVKSYDLLSEDLKGTLPVNRTIVFNCNDPEKTVCVQAIMEVYNFKPETPIIVTMSYIVDLKEVNQILIEPWEFFVVLVGLDVVKINGLASSLSVNKKIEYNIISKHQLYGTPIWVIILAILGGILVLALITYGMYRAGFFKRATKEEMDKLVHQAQISSDGVTEASNLNDEND